MSDNPKAPATDEILSLTVDIVAAHVANNLVAVADLPGLITTVHAAVAGLDAPAPAEPAKQEPAVSVRASVKPDYIVCLDGKKLKMLKRYLRTNYDMSPDEYRQKWNLASDYPMVAPAYAEKRRTLAHSIGLGRKSTPVEESAPGPAEVAPAPKARRGRPAKVVEAVPAEKPARKPSTKRLSGAAALVKMRGKPVEA